MSRVYYTWVVSVWCVMLGFHAYAQPPQPVLTCVSVESSTTVQVSWDIPVGSFDGFRLFYRQSGDLNYVSNDYSSITSTVTINTPNVLTNKYEFFLVTLNFLPEILSPSSNQLETMLLFITGDGTGIARLEWNKQSAQDLSYTILRSEDNVTFTPLNTTSSNIYMDTLTAPYCTMINLYYRIESGTCNAKSNTRNGLFYDDKVPVDPRLSLVTINNGLAEVYWEPSNSTDVGGYSIERKEGLQYNFYRSVGNVNSFVDDYVGDADYIGPCDFVVTYIIRTIDLCGNESSGEFAYPGQQTILLEGNTTELCDKKATLRWNAYNSLVSDYTVQKSINAQPFQNIASIPGGSALNYDYIDPEMLDAGVPVSYRIAANLTNQAISYSCEKLLVPEPEQVSEFDIEYVTVTNNDFLTLNMNGTPPALIHTVEILRAENAGSFELLTTIEWDNRINANLEDHQTEVNSQSYTYKVVAFDICGFEIAASGEYNSLLLSLFSDENSIRLMWNNHRGWDINLQYYHVYKYNDGILESGYPVVVSSAVSQYDDYLIESNALRTTYAVEAISNDGRVSRSNEVLFARPAQIDVPNAYRPEGISKIFKPLIKNIDPNAYIFIIYNRWGQKVYETNNPYEGWDGTHQGTNAPQGIYVYRISYKDQQGTVSAVSGSLYLLR